MNYAEKLWAAINIALKNMSDGLQKALIDPSVWAAIAIGIAAIAAIQLIPIANILSDFGIAVAVVVGAVVSALITAGFALLAAWDFGNFLIKSANAQDEAGLEDAAKSFEGFATNVGPQAVGKAFQLMGKALPAIKRLMGMVSDLPTLQRLLSAVSYDVPALYRLLKKVPSPATLESLLSKVGNNVSTLDRLLARVSNSTTLNSLLTKVGSNVSTLDRLLDRVPNSTTLNSLLSKVDDNVPMLERLLDVVGNNTLTLQRLLGRVKNGAILEELLSAVSNDIPILERLLNYTKNNAPLLKGLLNQFNNNASKLEEMLNLVDNNVAKLEELLGFVGNNVAKLEEFLTSNSWRGFTVNESKFDYFFGRVTSTPKNQQRSLQNLNALRRLGINESDGGRKKLMWLFQEGLNTPVIETKRNEFGTTLIRSVRVNGGKVSGSLEIGYFYPNGDISATPQIATIIPKIDR